MTLDITFISSLIHLFLWVGGGFFAILIVLTGFVWATMLAEKIVELAGRRMGFLYAGHFYCGLSLTRAVFGGSTEELQVAAGRDLYLRFILMRSSEPVVAKVFLEELNKESQNVQSH